MVVVRDKTIPVRSLRSVVLALIPARCKCSQTLRQLTAQAARAGVQVYFVGTPSAMPDVNALARTAGQGTAVAVKDAENVLGSAYHHAGLTIVLVRADASATVNWNLTEGFQLEDQLRMLGAGARSASPEPEPAHFRQSDLDLTRRWAPRRAVTLRGSLRFPASARDVPRA